MNFLFCVVFNGSALLTKSAHLVSFCSLPNKELPILWILIMCLKRLFYKNKIHCSLLDLLVLNFSYLKSSGRALEELKSSLFNELRTSEGAKRQQQRFCGPVVALTFNFMVAVGIIMANKLVCAFSISSFMWYFHYFVCFWRFS